MSSYDLIGLYDQSSPAACNQYLDNAEQSSQKPNGDVALDEAEQLVAKSFSLFLDAFTIFENKISKQSKEGFRATLSEKFGLALDNATLIPEQNPPSSTTPKDSSLTDAVSATNGNSSDYTKRESVQPGTSKTLAITPGQTLARGPTVNGSVRQGQNGVLSQLTWDDLPTQDAAINDAECDGKNAVNGCNGHTQNGAKQVEQGRNGVGHSNAAAAPRYAAEPACPDEVDWTVMSVALESEIESVEKRLQDFTDVLFDILHERGAVNSDCNWCRSLRDTITRELFPQKVHN